MGKILSVYLDLARLTAALVVFATHAVDDRFTGGVPFLSLFQGLGNDAVMVFFVLSGFVISYVADTKEKTPREYLLSRLARLYSVAAPALVLTVLLDHWGSRIDYSTYDGWWYQNSNGAVRFVISFFFANELWFESIRPFSNGPYWSLGFEFWYYLIFGAWFYLKRPVSLWVTLALCAIVGPKILLLFPIWLLGVWAYRRVQKRPVSEAAGWVLFLGSAIGYVVFRQLGGPEVLTEWTRSMLGPKAHESLTWSRWFASSYVIGVLVTLHFIGAAAIQNRLGFLLAVQAPIRYAAAFTFAIYLLHYPLLQFFTALTVGVTPTWLHNFYVLAGTSASIWLVGLFTESRKGALRRFLDSATRKFYK